MTDYSLRNAFNEVRASRLGSNGLFSVFDGWKRTPAEISAGVTPIAYYREELDPRRYASIADWTAVYNQINSLLLSYAGWYRGDRAQHPALTNCIVGYQAYNDAAMTATFGYRCTAFGVLTLSQNSNSTIAGGSNTAVGYASQQDSVDTSGNTSVGTKTLASCTGVNSAHNGAFGNSALEAIIAGTQNNAFAYRAIYQLVRGDNNTGMGDVVLQGLIAGNANTCYGAQAGFTKPGGNFLTAISYQACFHETAALISAISKAASAVVTLSTVSGVNPYVANDYVTFSDVAGMVEINNLSGIVTAVGGASGAWTVTVNINSSGFTAYTSGGYLGPHGNIGVGYKTQFENTYASGNTTVGTETASTAVLGIANSLFGFQAGRVINGASFNSIYGWRAGLATTTAVGNALFGQQAGSAITTGGQNVCIGGNAGNAITTGIKNTSVGDGAGTADGSNRQSFGFNAQCTGDNQFTLGDANIVTLRCQQTTITALSDARFKKNIRALELPEGALEDLQPVVFEWIAEGMAQGPQMGFIAQALDEWQTKWRLEWMGLVSKTDPERWEATPGRLLFPLILGFQKLSARVAALEAK